MRFNYLPGVQISVIDGGLVTLREPRTKSVLVVGTAGKGPADTPYQVTDRSIASELFGVDGTLVRGMEEVQVYSDNIILFRMGSAPATLTGVGKEIDDEDDSVINPGFDIIFGERTADAKDRYKVYYDAGALYIWKDGILVFKKDGASALNTGDCTVSGSGVTGGLKVGTAISLDAKTLKGAVAIGDIADDLTATATGPLPVLVDAKTGLGMNACDTYVAQQKAFDLLDTFQVQAVYTPNALFDQPNVAFYAPADAQNPTAAEKVNDPSANTSALGWLKTTTDAYGDKVFHWAHRTSDSSGATVTPPTFSDAADRLSKGYHEVNFGYQLARYAARQSEVQGGCLGFIGCAAPAGFDMPQLRPWIGYLPKYESGTNKVTVSGRGLLGIPYMVGCALAQLNPLCREFDPTVGATFRSAGMYQTGTDEYDGGPLTDKNQNPIDIGAYLHVCGDWALYVNGFGRYTGNIAGIVAGYYSYMDPKDSLTNKQLTGVAQLHIPNLAQLDSLTKANINMLKKHRLPNQSPVLLHGMTAASDNSDYINVLRQGIKFLVVKQLFDTADAFIGKSSTDGLQLQSLKTALDAKMVNLQKTGYIGVYNFTIESTDADRKIGRANINILFEPAEELVQLNATVGIRRR